MSRTLFKKRTLSAIAAVLVAGAFSASASAALVITGVTDQAAAGATLTSALLAPSSGITAGAISYQGTNTANLQQSGTFTGFNLAPTSGSSPTLTLADGIFLSSGNVNVVQNNSSNSTSVGVGSGSNALLTDLSGQSTNDANALSIDFTVGAGITSVSAQFVFGTEEFPTQTVTDIFGFFVDGVNFAKFSNGQLISNTPGNPTNFISNPVGGGLYGIEYNGLTQVFTVTGLLGAGVGGVHNITIAIADTSDSIYDSGVFVSSLKAGTATGGGIGNDVPEPGSLALAGLALVAAAAIRRGKKA